MVGVNIEIRYVYKLFMFYMYGQTVYDEKGIGNYISNFAKKNVNVNILSTRRAFLENYF